MDTPIKPSSRAKGPRRLNAVAALNAIGEGTFETLKSLRMVVDSLSSRHDADTTARGAIRREYVCQRAFGYKVID